MTTFIIAEAGTGHAATDPERRYYLARDLVEAAAWCGADAIKFQLFLGDESLFCPKPGDNKRTARWCMTHMDLDSWKMVQDHAETKQIELMFSCFQSSAIDMVKDIGTTLWKVASRASRTFPYHELPDAKFLVSLGKGMPQYAPPDQCKFLQCEMSYPTPLPRAWWHGDTDGLSDHSGNVAVGIHAIAKGAEFLEVHFTIKDEDDGPDAAVSLSVADLKTLCETRDALA